ncbi:mitogen-activated protein kinase kinase kinase YODA-like [Impatiens glandulifera]|uniref:mitogen-activated protein kinase kinase kinase YODA-like n=1 Tax=Impatiens glandulifera TaxID=253017 RepID=UPI001FB0ABAA|nr:mitogen-activated protein kinase kinase kinase YODA-like [Impatiens glandulifera]
MPPWWGKSTSKDVKKKSSKGSISKKEGIPKKESIQNKESISNKDSIFYTINKKLHLSCEENGSNGSKKSLKRRLTDISSKKGSGLYLHLRPRSSSVPRCQSFSEWSHSHPLPLPGKNLSRKASSSAVIDMPTTSGVTPLQTLPKPGHVERVSELSSVYHNSDNQSQPRLLTPQTSSLSKNGNRNALKDHSRMRRKDISHVQDSKNSKEMLRTSISLQNQTCSTSPLGSPTVKLWSSPHGAFSCAPDSSSPSKSPMRLFGYGMPRSCWSKQCTNIAVTGSGQCTSPGKGRSSRHDSVVGDMPGRPHSRCSTEHSPIPSPIMVRSEPTSRIQSGSVTPVHQRAGAGAAAIESPIMASFDKKQQSYRLPLPPLTIPNCNPFPASYSTTSSPAAPRSPGKVETPKTPDSRWKKGRLLGRGTFGHVYLGFNSQSGEMCAMKEVTLFSDDKKSKESAQQLVQEITLLSGLQHPNIVQYYGSDTVDDNKLYIYLEYVSGGSIHKLLQDYGPLGETAIRNFTRQILCGLAYLHAKNTVHRDIKGANILVDPNGCVKLADFGMAKHINGQPCPLSLKGSPYWMAPEVIKNSSGCNLAVDIWSLGCTVLEMANGKPPWSQYEGVAAMFKIGNSKELPVIPDELGDHGKDFVRQCLQRNPANRPTAAQLLDHPFIRRAVSPLERPIANPNHPEVPIVTNRMKSLVIEYNKHISSQDSEPNSKHHPSRRSKSSLRSSYLNDIQQQPQQRNISCPVSPLASSPLASSPLASPPLTSSPIMRSSLSPPPFSSPHNTPGSSSFRNIQYQQPIIYSSPVIYREPPSHLMNSPRKNSFLPESEIRKVPNGQSALADQVSRHLFRDDHSNSKMNKNRNPTLF